MVALDTQPLHCATSSVLRGDCNQSFRYRPALRSTLLSSQVLLLVAAFNALFALGFMRRIGPVSSSPPSRLLGRAHSPATLLENGSWQYHWDLSRLFRPVVRPVKRPTGVDVVVTSHRSRRCGRSWSSSLGNHLFRDGVASTSRHVHEPFRLSRVRVQRESLWTIQQRPWK